MEDRTIADIPYTFDPQHQEFDWPDFSVLAAPANSSLDLETAVVLSLFTDRVAQPDYVGNARGCWIDTYEGPLGSRLWLLERTTTAGAKQRATDYCHESLAWIITDKIADQINVDVQWLTSTALGIQIDVYEPKKTTPRRFNYSFLWRAK